MSLTIQITQQDGAGPFVAELSEDIQPSTELHRYIADEAHYEVQQRFLALAETNRGVLGHSGFWNRMLSGTSALADETAAMVRMPREVAQRYFGGTITPQGGKTYLTIPARSEAYGKSARQFNDLRFVPFRSGAAALVQRDQTELTFFKSGKRKGQIKDAKETGGAVFFWLVKSVTQRGNSEVLPDDETFAGAIVRGIESFLEARGYN